MLKILKKKFQNEIRQYLPALKLVLKLGSIELLEN